MCAKLVVPFPEMWLTLLFPAAVGRGCLWPGSWPDGQWVSVQGGGALAVPSEFQNAQPGPLWPSAALEGATVSQGCGTCLLQPGPRLCLLGEEGSG